VSSIAPVLLLDLDGVLNPFAAPVCPDGYLEREFFAGEGPERYCVAHGAWIDDNHTAAGRRWAAERSAPTLLVSIDPALGWTRADVDQVLDWTAALRR
jgi:hypothetical protein